MESGQALKPSLPSVQCWLQRGKLGTRQDWCLSLHFSFHAGSLPIPNSLFSIPDSANEED